MKLLFRWINKLLCGWNVGLYFPAAHPLRGQEVPPGLYTRPGNYHHEP